MKYDYLYSVFIDPQFFKGWKATECANLTPLVQPATCQVQQLQLSEAADYVL